jgi:hypothetical protein
VEPFGPVEVPGPPARPDIADSSGKVRRAPSPQPPSGSIEQMDAKVKCGFVDGNVPNVRIVNAVDASY